MVQTAVFQPIQADLLADHRDQGIIVVALPYAATAIIDNMCPSHLIDPTLHEKNDRFCLLDTGDTFIDYRRPKSEKKTNQSTNDHKKERKQNRMKRELRRMNLYC